jgi:hypothetical protein
MSKIEIILPEHLDREKIEAILTDTGSYEIVVSNGYQGDLLERYTLNMNAMSSTYKEAFLKFIDTAVFSIEQDALVFKVIRTSKTFNLESSYIHDRLSTVIPLAAIDDGTPLTVTFEVAGFSENVQRTINLLYNQSFDPAEVTALAEIGIDLTGDGLEFTIDNSRECKVIFSKPTGATDIYVIDYVNEIIAV